MTVAVPPSSHPPPLTVSNIVGDTERALASARAEIAALQAELARVAACLECQAAVAALQSSTQPAGSTSQGSFRGHVAGVVMTNTSYQSGQADVESTNALPCHRVTSAPMVVDRESRMDTGVRENGCSESREMLSHCSDISGSHKPVPSISLVSFPSPLPGENGTSSNGVTDKLGNVVLETKHNPLNNTSNSKRSAAKAVSGAVKKPSSKPRKERNSSTKPRIPGQSRYWTPEEHKLFLEALNKYGYKDLKSISAWVGTRNMTQVRTHSQKYFMRLMREAKRQNPIEQSPSRECDSAQDGGANDAYASEIGSPASDGSPQYTADIVQNESGIRKRKVSLSLPEGSNGCVSHASDANKQLDNDKYSVPSSCGMMLLCLVGQDTLTS